MKVQGWSGLVRAAVCSAVVVALIACAVGTRVGAQDGAPGQLTEKDLGEVLQSMGLKPEKIEKRYDFSFKAVYKGEEWKLSMSAVLSQNGKSVWVMAWLDQIPSSAAEVPRVSLLRLLAANDRLGNGKFFAYIPANKRFVLQRVVPNSGMSSAALRNVLKDLGTSVVEEYPTWSVAGWTNSPATLSQGTNPNGASPTRTSANDPAYGERRIR